MYVECTAACNISCNQACCAPETGITRTRQAGMLDFDLFTRVIDEAGPSLGRVDFFNYGEAFLHKRAVEMCEYIKSKFPHIYLYTSTNGLALTEEKARRLVHSGIDEVTFSIDGASQDTYVQYRQRGDFDKALANLRAMADEKRTPRPRRAAPELALHPLQVERSATKRWTRPAVWPSRSASIACAGRSPITRKTASRGASSLAPTTTRPSPRNLGPEQPRQRHPRRDAARADRRQDAGARACRFSPGAAGRVQLQTRVTNLSNRRFAAQASYGRRLVRLGAQLCAADGTLINRDYARAWLPHHLEGGQHGRRRNRDSRHLPSPGDTS